MMIISREIGLGKFTQLDKDFDVQEENWRRCFVGKGYLLSLWWNGCATGKLEEAFRKEVFVIDEARIEVAKLDAKRFDDLINWLPALQRSVYIADTINKVIKGGKCLYTKASDRTHKQTLLDMTKFRYESLLVSAIHNMKKHGGLV